MKAMKATRKAIPALSLLLVSAAVLSSASYAWFTMSRQVTANGMNVTVTAPNNLLIDGKGAAADGWSELQDLTAATGVKLRPTSSVDGKAFFSIATGSVADSTSGAMNDKAVVSSDDVLATAGTVGTYYDFEYQVKTEGDTAVNVALSTLNVTDNGTDISADDLKPVRVAIMEGTTVVKIYNVTGGTYRTPDKAFKGEKLTTETYATVAADDTKMDDVLTYETTVDNTATLFTCAANGVAKDITIRVWFEGEDTSCTAAKCAKAKFKIEAVFVALT